MESILREIDNRIAKKRIEIIKKDLNCLDCDYENHLNNLKDIKKIYHKVLEKDRPVGKGINAIRYLKNVR
jgi:hypothetical protein